jgi:hypothetical protein
VQHARVLPHEIGVAPELLEHVPPVGDIGWNSYETRMFKRNNTHVTDHGSTVPGAAYEALPSDIYRKLAEDGTVLSFSDRILHARVPLVPTPARLKLVHVCDQ